MQLREPFDSLILLHEDGAHEVLIQLFLLARNCLLLRSLLFHRLFSFLDPRLHPLSLFRLQGLAEHVEVVALKQLLNRFQGIGPRPLLLLEKLLFRLRLRENVEQRHSGGRRRQGSGGGGRAGLKTEIRRQKPAGARGRGRAGARGRGHLGKSVGHLFCFLTPNFDSILAR